ncbi:exopolyphosphatase [soil metagenome]
MPRVYAAADIGSNTAHLLVGASDGQLVMRLDNYNEWIPLGEVVSKHGQVPKEYVNQLVLACREFKRMAASHKAETLYVFATEGMRMARNHEAVLKRIKDEVGIVVDIIPPSREAELSFLGVGLDTRNFGVDTLFEVGGGSLQIGRIGEGKLLERESLPLGTGRIIAESGLRNPCPPWAMEAAHRYIEQKLKESEIVSPARMAVASGGVGRGLWRAIHPDGEKMLSIEEIDYVGWSVARLPLDRIIQRFGVKQKRAGTLLPGAMVYGALMRRYGLKEMAISEFGIREGAILEMAGRNR